MSLRLSLLLGTGVALAQRHRLTRRIGPRSKRPRRVNTSWGGIGTNAFGLHEPMDLVQLVGAEHDGLNDFGAAPSVQPAPFTGAQRPGDRIRFSLPSKSVTVLALE